MLQPMPWIMLNSMLKNSHRVRFWYIASDIAKYGIGTPGEPNIGPEWLPLLISQNPRILSFNDDNKAQTRDVMDFLASNYATTPFSE